MTTINPKIIDNISTLEEFTKRPQLEAPIDSNLFSIDNNTFENNKMNESIRPGLYSLQDYNFTDCYQEFPGFNRSNVYGPREIDLESDFRGIGSSHYLTKNDSLENDPYLNFQKELENNKYRNSNVNCINQFIPEYTKTSKACDNISIIQQDRFEFPLVDMEIQSNNLIGDNSRLRMRDIEATKIIDRTGSNGGNVMGSLPNPYYCNTESNGNSNCIFVDDKDGSRITGFF